MDVSQGLNHLDKESKDSSRLFAAVDILAAGLRRQPCGVAPPQILAAAADSRHRRRRLDRVGTGAHRVVVREMKSLSLALSPRNVRLSPEERHRARAIPRALLAGIAAHRASVDLVAAAREELSEMKVDYLAVTEFTASARSALPRVGEVRLIDNVRLDDVSTTSDAVTCVSAGETIQLATPATHRLRDGEGDASGSRAHEGARRENRDGHGL